MNEHEQFTVSAQPLVDQRMKIQVAKGNVDTASAEGGVKSIWADLKGTPEFACAAEAWQYINQHDGEQLQQGGVQFRVMPMEYPCKYEAFLEKMVKA